MSHSPRRIALTGGIASGKTTVAEYLKQHGLPVIDADELVHRLLLEDKGLKTRIREAFGPEVFGPAGEVNRQKLGLAVFKDADRRKLLESWIHPKVRDAIERFYLENPDAGKAVSVIPLLFESNLEDRYDEVWLIETDETRQLDRLITRRGMRREDALARIQSQMPLDKKIRRAHAHPCAKIIRNTGSPEALYRQIDALLKE
jgi:dephospho-CoA kinase